MADWGVLVADAETARLFATDASLERLERLEARRARTPVPPERVWVADRRGRPRDPEAWPALGDRAFARDLAGRLLRAVGEEAFDELVVVAPTAFLTLLREECDGAVAERVIAEVPRNLTWVPERALGRRLERHLRRRIPSMA